MPASKSSRLSRVFELTVALALAASLGVLAACWFLTRRQPRLRDAAAHLNIARRIVDSRTPGYSQIGTVWLPLPHLLLAPLAARDEWWRSGVAGVIPSTVEFVLAAVFLFAAARRAFSSAAAAFAALALFALNPNLLYLQATPMTEPLMLASLAALLYTTVRFRETQSMGAVIAAALAALAGTLTRYEGWFLIPFATLYFLVASKRRRILNAAVFGAVASLGPLYWLAHNYWIFGNALEFYNGPYSAMAIYQRSLASRHDRVSGKSQLARGAPLLWRGRAMRPGFAAGRLGAARRAGLRVEACVLALAVAGSLAAVLRSEPVFVRHADLSAAPVAECVLQHALRRRGASAGRIRRRRAGGSRAAPRPGMGRDCRRAGGRVELDCTAAPGRVDRVEGSAGKLEQPPRGAQKRGPTFCGPITVPARAWFSPSPT